MKYLYFIIAILCLSFKCDKNKNDKYKDPFIKSLYSKDTLIMHQLQYRNNQNLALFHNNYQIIASKKILKKDILLLKNLLQDSTNFDTLKSKNCVLIAQYGFDLHSDSSNYQIYFGKEPCAKILFYNEKLQTEIIKDLQETNTILPFIDRIFSIKK